MSGIKTLRNRIKSVKSTQKITKAMKMVSASKLHRAKDACFHTSIFKARVSEILLAAKDGVVPSDCDDYTKSLLFGDDSTEVNEIAIIISSDRGLCGTYNSSVLKLVRKNLPKNFLTKVILIGTKLKEFLAKDYKDKFIYETEVSRDPEAIKDDVIEVLNNEFQKNPNLKVSIFYTEYKNTLTQITKMDVIWPVQNIESSTKEKKYNLEFEGSNILRSIADIYINNSVILSILYSKASEEALRMTTMDNATKNAGEMIEKLTLKMNRSRQTAITKELIEVISGVESV